MFDNTSDFHVFMSPGLALASLDSIFPRLRFGSYGVFFELLREMGLADLGMAGDCRISGGRTRTSLARC